MPKLTAWRIDKQKWARSSFTGEGAALEGGRWNSANVRVVYASASLAMASQEKYVHLPKPVPPAWAFVKFMLSFDDSLVETLPPHKLRRGWNVAPVPDSTQRIGDEWVSSARTPILAVPSAIVSGELNYILNPLHPLFGRIEIGDPEGFSFDYRIARLIEPTNP